MKGKILSLLILLLLMAVIVNTKVFQSAESSSLSLNIGFMLLIGFLVGELVGYLGLPKITGYMLVGLIFGPYFLKFLSFRNVTELNFINSLALAFIAFCAGAELHYQKLKKKIKSIIYMITGVTIIVFIGVTLGVFFILDIFPFMGEINAVYRITIASLFGVIAVARSPSSAIAIINETKAKGNYCDLILSVSIAMDVFIIIIFAIIVSIAELVFSGGTGQGVNFIFVFELLGEILIAFICGFLLGKGIIWIMDKIKIEFPVVVVTMGFIVIKFSHYLADVLKDVYEIGLNIEPLLICMVAGFTVQNFSKQGEKFVKELDKISLPIYVAFFVIIGASINMDILKKSWMIGLAIFGIRCLMLYFGSYISGRSAGEAPMIYKNAWLGFITQAGVSLGLLSEIVRRFPGEIGLFIQSVLIATIAINQIIGPITFKLGLKKNNEIGMGK